jgi:hypothetical protein
MSKLVRTKLKTYSPTEDGIIIDCIKNSLNVSLGAKKASELIFSEFEHTRTPNSILNRYYTVLKRKDNKSEIIVKDHKITRSESKNSEDFIDVLLGALSKEQKQKIAVKLINELL